MYLLDRKSFLELVLLHQEDRARVRIGENPRLVEKIVEQRREVPDVMEPFLFF
jgi:hypothetical protein